MKNKDRYDLTYIEWEIREDGIAIFYKAMLINTLNVGASCFPAKYHVAKWLEQEYQEPVTLTDDEKAILKNLPKRYEWIAKDKSGRLFLYLIKPLKTGTCWESESIEPDFSMYDDLFQFIKWEDENPYNIDELLKQNGVER